MSGPVLLLKDPHAERSFLLTGQQEGASLTVGYQRKPPREALTLPRQTTLSYLARDGDRSVGAKCLKSPSMPGTNLDKSNISIPRFWTLVKVENHHKACLSNLSGECQGSKDEDWIESCLTNGDKFNL